MTFTLAEISQILTLAAKSGKFPGLTMENVANVLSVLVIGKEN